MHTWNLDDLYKGFDSEFEKDVNIIKELVDQSITLAPVLKDGASLAKWLHHEQTLSTLIINTSAYVSLVRSVDSTNAKASSINGQLMAIYSKLSVPNAQSIISSQLTVIT